ncbi:hypothetical protein Q8F55_007370 [Vanrija albida]|uniref:Copper acquisition factor BIM1-like domain-containing protein n=1 Tax=Vanrija albida TaxID=181172 RepID=A0ABR3PTC3_9TREE
MLFQTLATLAAGASLASAVAIEPRASIMDFDGKGSPVTFAFPAARGFIASKAKDAPCGGVPVGKRTPFPLSGGDVALSQKTNIDNLNILYTKDSDPSRFHAFSSYTQTITNIGAGHYCTKGPDFAQMGFKAGDDATLLLIYQLDGEKGYNYHCADVSLVESAGFKAQSEYVCGNYTSTLNVASKEDSMNINAFDAGTMGANPHKGDENINTSSNVNNSGANASSSSSKKDGLSAAAGGGIGAGVTVAVIGAVLAALYAVGRLHFGKRDPLALRNTQSQTSSTQDLKEVRV